MVQQHQHHVFSRSRLGHRDPHRGLTRQVEGVPGGLVHVAGLVDDNRSGVKDLLVRRAVDVREDGAQAFMPGKDILDRSAQRRKVRFAGNPQQQRDVIGRARPLQLIQEPQPLLREGQRDPVGSRHRHQRRADRFGGAERFGDAGDGGRLEEAADSQVHAEFRPDSADQAGGQQRVPAELEEPVVDADRVHAQHLGEQPAEDFLTGVAGATAVGIARELRGRQGLAVQLAVTGQGQLGQQHERDRNHVLRQPLGRILAQRARIAAALGHDVGDQALVAGRVLANDRGGMPDGSVLVEDGFDLAELDPEATDLHLVVHPRDEFEHAVGVPAGDVAGPVEPGTRRTVRVGHELGRGQAGPVQIATGNQVAGDVKLAFDADRGRAQRRVQHVHLRVPNRPTDRHHSGGHRVAGFDPVFGATDGGFGRAVLVDHGRAGVAGPPLLQHLAHQRLPAQHELLRRRALRRQRQQHRQVARRGLDERGLLGQPRGFVELDQLRAATRGERREQAGHGQVERHRRVHQRAPGHRGVRRADPRQVLVERVVLDDDALGPAGGTRGEDHERGVAVGQLPDRICSLHCGQIELVDQQPRGTAGQPTGEIPVGQGEHRADIVEHEFDPLSRMRRVQRQIRPARLEHREQRDHQLHGARQRDGDEPLRADPLGDQQPGKPIRPAVELGVVEHGVAEGHGGRVRRAADLLLDQLGQGRRNDLVAGAVPLVQHEIPLVVGQDVQIADRGARIGRHRFENADQARRDGLGAAAVEQVGGEFQHALHPARIAVGGIGLFDVEGQVDLGHVRAAALPLHDEPGEFELRVFVAVKVQHDLEQRVPGHRPDRVDHLHQPLERHVLVRVGGQVGAPDPGQQFQEARIAGGVGAQHQGVHEEPDHFVQRLITPAAHRGAQRDVIARAHPGQQGRDRALDHHEHAGLVLPGDPRQRAVRGAAELEFHAVAPVRGHGRAGPVGRQLQLRRDAIELFAPEAELPRHQAFRVVLAPEQFSLPQRVVGVLHR